VLSSSFSTMSGTTFPWWRAGDYHLSARHARTDTLKVFAQWGLLLHWDALHAAHQYM
jgi:hypothetical protein